MIQWESFVMLSRVSLTNVHGQNGKQNCCTTVVQQLNNWGINERVGYLSAGKSDKKLIAECVCRCLPYKRLRRG